MLIVISFLSSHQAMLANKILAKSNFKCEIIPTPREISSECGFSILGEVENLETFHLFINEMKLDYAKIYIKRGSLYEKSRW